MTHQEITKGIFLTTYYVIFKVGGSSVVSFTIDTTPPVISALSVENKTYSTSDVPLNVTVNEPVSQVIYSLDGQENVTISGNTTLTGLANRDHSLIVYAKDEAGNIGTSKTITFTVAESFPTALVATASVVTVAVVGAVTLLIAVVYFKKRKH
jgi:hypothetical protein